MVPRHARRKQVLEHIINHGGITRAYALAVFHVQNLAHVVMELRRMGWRIRTTVFKREDGVRVVLYYITDIDVHFGLFLGRLYTNEDGTYGAYFS